MAGDYTKQAATALKLIKAKGQTVTISRNLQTFDPVVGANIETGDPPAVACEGQAVRLPNYKGLAFEGMDNAFKQALVTGQATILLLAAKGLSFPPAPGYQVTLGDGSIWFIKGLTPLSPAGQPIIYTMGVMLK